MYMQWWICKVHLSFRTIHCNITMCHWWLIQPIYNCLIFTLLWWTLCHPDLSQTFLLQYPDPSPTHTTSITQILLQHLDPSPISRSFSKLQIFLFFYFSSAWIIFQHPDSSLTPKVSSITQIILLHPYLCPSSRSCCNMQSQPSFQIDFSWKQFTCYRSHSLAAKHQFTTQSLKRFSNLKENKKKVLNALNNKNKCTNLGTPHWSSADAASSISSLCQSVASPLRKGGIGSKQTGDTTGSFIAGLTVSVKVNILFFIFSCIWDFLLLGQSIQHLICL